MAGVTEPPEDVSGLGPWFDAQIPDTWFTGPVSVLVDRDEIVVSGDLRCPDAGDADGAAAHAEKSAITTFREATREQRMAVAQRAEALFGRKVSWGATCGGSRGEFTSLSVPVMTRLHIDERIVLDTLVAAGVARSRSDALGWCVRLVASNEGEWIGRLRSAIEQVDRVRADGPPCP